MPFDSLKEFTYLKGFAFGAGLHDTISMLNFAREQHGGQNRKDGTPYISHPLTMACHAVAMGIRDDVVLAGILGHDICEDCDVSTDELPVSTEVQRVVVLCTKTGLTNAEYYSRLEYDIRAILVKLFDRCHNVSTMAGVFSEAKLREYVDETKEFVLPLIRVAKDKYPKYSPVLFVLKYHIESVLNAVEVSLANKEGS